MGFNTVPLLATGDWIDAAWGNTYWRDNLAALYPYTMAGDLAYAVSAGGALARLGIGGTGALLYSGGSAPAWKAAGAAGSLLYGAGAAAPNWLAVGTAGQILQSTGSAPAWVSGERYIPVYLNSDVALAVGDYQGWFMIPPALNGWNITHVSACRKAGGTGVPELQLRNVTYALDVLSTKVTIDSGETTSGTAATPPVINTLNNYCETYAQFAVDVDVAGSNTYNCLLIVGFSKL